jgi:glutathione S-transferase
MNDFALATLFPLTGLATLLAIAVYFWTGIVVTQARKRFDVPAPRTEGSEDFLRVWRAHVNTLEQLVMFLPLLWLFSFTAGKDIYAAVAGAVWAVGRIIYVLGYAKAANKRGLGFMISLFATAVCFVGTLIYILRTFL